MEPQTLTYGRAGSHRLELDFYRARDDGTHAIVMVHGGAWTTNNRRTPYVVCEALAQHGYNVFSLDFRDGRNARHPCAVADITTGIRFIRRNAKRLGVDGTRIGLIGSSSGGHLVLVSAYAPDREAHRTSEVAVSLNGDDFGPADDSAAIDYAIALWPVSDPLARYRYAETVGREELRAAHLRYFADEEHMAASSVQRLLRDGPDCRPPTMVVQPGADQNVPRDMTLDLVTALQEAEVPLRYAFNPGLPHAYAYEASPETTRLVHEIVPFIEHRRGRV